MEKIISVLSAFGIRATDSDVEAILGLEAIEQNAIPALEEEAESLRAQLDTVESELLEMKRKASECRSRSGDLKNVSRSSGLPIESNEHSTRTSAALYYLRQRATVEPVHRAEVSQYVYGNRDDDSLKKLALVLHGLKRKLLVRNGPRGYWFPL